MYIMYIMYMELYHAWQLIQGRRFHSKLENHKTFPTKFSSLQALKIARYVQPKFFSKLLTLCLIAKIFPLK